MVVISPGYPKADKLAPLPIEIERMRASIAAQWFSPSNPSGEAMRDDSRAIWQFVGIDRRRGPICGKTMIGKFEHLLETYQLY